MMHDEPAFIDFETYFSQTFTLSKLMTAEYILHHEFQIMGMGIAIGDDAPRWLTGEPLFLRAALEEYDLPNRLVVAHNAIFDGAILEWKLGIRPKKYFCTMMGARPIYAPHVKSMSLDSLTRHLGVPHPFKNYQVLTTVKGLRREEASYSAMAKVGKYCCDDVALMRHVYKDLDSKLPDDERELIDITLKKFIQPKLKVDTKALTLRAAEIEEENQQAIDSAGVAKTTLMSNPQFAAQLQHHGVTPPMKTSPTTGNPTFAFSKQDLEFLALQHPPAPVPVRRLVKARLTLKSTIERSRIERLLALAKRTRWLPAPLLYYGAHTGRWSGLDKINLQNLTRGSVLRQALVAPPGYKVLAADLSQIEARVLAHLAGCQKLLQQFAGGEDVYSKFASKVYGRPVIKNRDDTERFVGKTAILGLGYGLGWLKFLDTMLLADISMSRNMAQKVVFTYREIYPQIPELWSTMDMLISHALSVNGSLRAFGPLVFSHEHILLPNQMTLTYPGLTHDREAGRGWKYIDPKGGWKKLYGGKLTENVVQALARIILSTAELRLARHGLRAALTVHDELVYVIRESQVEKVALAVEKALTAPVPWMPGLPLACEVKWGDNYGDCK